jgi:hypothetical protein
MGPKALEYAVTEYIYRMFPYINVFKHPRGWPAIELPNPDGTWEAHPIHSKHTYAWIQSGYSRSTLGRVVLTEAEVKRVALLLAGDAYVNAPPPLSLPMEPTAKYEPVLEAVVNFMHYSLRVDKATTYDGPVKDLKEKLHKAAARLGLAARSIPEDTSWLGRIIRRLECDLLNCGIRASFYRTEVARCIVLKWVTQPPPLIDGKDGNLTSTSNRTDGPNPPPNNPLSPADGNDAIAVNEPEPDWSSLKRKGD